MSRFQLFSLVFICVVLPNRASAQPPQGVDHRGYNYAKHGRYPVPPPYWNYPGLAGGPYITNSYAFAGFPGYRGAYGSYWTNGLSLYGPPVPVYGSIPGVLGNSDLVNQWQARPTIGGGFGYVGWVGTFRASPRPFPSVNPWPLIEPFGPSVRDVPPEALGACLHLSVKVSQPAAEVFVDGVKTLQSGLDRIYESPPLLDADKEYAYTIVARWVERGTTFERKKTVVGKPGEVIRVDLTAP